MKKILIVTEELSLGGITSFAINLVNFISQNNYDVTLMYPGSTSKNLEGINKDVNIIEFKTPSRNEIIARSIFSGYLPDLIRKKINNKNRNKISLLSTIQKTDYIKAKYSENSNIKYDVVISAAEFFCNDYIALNTISKKKIGWFHTDYGSLNIDSKFHRKTLDLLDKVITVSNASKESLLESLPCYKNKVMTIKNIIDFEKIEEKSKQHVDDFNFDGFKIVTVARLDNTSKRLDRAINACKKLVENNLNIRWYLIGEGEDRDLLKSMVIDLGLEEHFIMLGSKSNPYPYIKNSDLFVLTSQYEGKPIVVDEAFILQCPVVVTNYKSAKEQVSSNYGQVVMEEDNDFSESLLRIVSNKNIITGWKENLKNFEYNNNDTYFSLISLIEEDV